MRTSAWFRPIDRLMIPVLLGAAVLTVFLVMKTREPAQPPANQPGQGLATFSSCQELSQAVEKAQSSRYWIEGLGPTLGLGAAPTRQSAVSERAEDFSTTNVQVAGVDEADIVKTDGKFLFLVSPQRQELAVIDAYPADAARLMSRTVLGISPTELFLDGNTAVILGSRSSADPLTGNVNGVPPTPPRSIGSLTVAQLWDVADRTKPSLLRQIEVEGSYLTARKIDRYVYLVANAYPYFAFAEDAVRDGTVVPLFRSVTSATAPTAPFRPVARCADVAYSPEILPQSFVTVLGLNLAKPNEEPDKEILLASGDNVYASLGNLYVAGYKHQGGFWLLEAIAPGAVETAETTVVNVFALNAGKVSHRGSLEAPGRVLNQFSMDEHEDIFRIATTKNESFVKQSGSSSGVYTFNNALERIGGLEELAPGERIYSARFMGPRLYLVTFQKVDPLFAIDLRDPGKPAILGKLKIPGYSDYLHPYDETHLLGLGKEAVAAEEGNFAWYQGLKLALFDVSDVANPKQLHNTIIGDRGSDSYALHDHKAFLFDRKRNLLVIPVLLAEIPEDQKRGAASNAYGDFTYQGAYVYELTLKNGFVLKGRVTHLDSDETFLKSGFSYYDDGNSVKRSLYLGDALYTVSDNRVFANALSDLKEIKRLSLCEQDCETAGFDQIR